MFCILRIVGFVFRFSVHRRFNIHGYSEKNNTLSLSYQGQVIAELKAVMRQIYLKGSLTMHNSLLMSF